MNAVEIEQFVCDAENQLSQKLPATLKGRLPTASQLATVVRQRWKAILP
ncbi:MAG: hypothetical protein IPN71_02075 [Fibrobacteres bacterium]|nr:hypothetical protein [Fibrobacterota bacterium]